MNTAIRDWVALGETEPFFGVLSGDAFRRANFDDEAEQAFFDSGRVHAAAVLDVLDRMLGFRPSGRALDFGCGVGRVTLALAPSFEAVVGADVSPGMLREAETIRLKRGAENVAYLPTTDCDVMKPEQYRFVHSYIVLQHMPVKDGLAAVRAMVGALAPGGVGAIHVTYGYGGRRFRHEVRNVAKTIPVAKALGNILTGRRWSAPAMQMNNYRLGSVIDVLAAGGVEQYHVVRVQDWENLGAFLFFRKPEPGDERSHWSNPAH